MSKGLKKLAPINMRALRTIPNVKEGFENKRGRNGEPLPTTTVNYLQWNPNHKYTTQFMTLDDAGFVSLYDVAKKLMIARNPTGLSLQTGCIEPTQGQMLLCGGTSDSISLFEINKVVKRGEKQEQMSLYKEYSGHSGNLTCCGFLNEEYFVTGS